MKNNSETFYKTIAAYYEQIFPLNQQAVGFAKSYLSAEAKVLDVGCATGALSCALSNNCKEIAAFDLNEAMVALAAQKGCEKVNFRVANMMEVEQIYPLQYFDVITCFGNTLVHLLSEQEILDFLKQAAKLLDKKGKLLLQILNYDTILDKKITMLPNIVNEKLAFERKYVFHKENHLLDFYTNLKLKEEEQNIQNKSLLYAIRPKELVTLLQQAGFSTIKMYSSFAKETLNNDKLPLVLTAML